MIDSPGMKIVMRQADHTVLFDLWSSSGPLVVVSGGALVSVGPGVVPYWSGGASAMLGWIPTLTEASSRDPRPPALRHAPTGKVQIYRGARWENVGRGA